MRKFEGFTDKELQDLIDKDETFVIRTFREFRELDNISKLIKNYNINTFEVVKILTGFRIIPDDKFKEIYIKLCLDRNIQHRDNLSFEISITEFPIGNIPNFIDFENGIDPILRGLSIGYKIYKLIINKIDFIITSSYNSLSAKKLIV